MSASNLFLPGYLQPVGAKLESFVDHSGPVSYNNTGTFLTSGETINAHDYGLGGFEMIIPQGLSGDGLYTAQIELVAQSGKSGASASAVIHWFTANSTEVANATDLHASFIRLLIRGV